MRNKTSEGRITWARGVGQGQGAKNCQPPSYVHPLTPVFQADTTWLMVWYTRPHHAATIHFSSCSRYSDAFLENTICAASASQSISSLMLLTCSAQGPTPTLEKDAWPGVIVSLQVSFSHIPVYTNPLPFNKS